MIESVHRKIIRGELWEKEAHVLPACVDCHQPHKARKLFYEQGMADKDCLTCHSRPELKAKKDGRSLYVNTSELTGSRHVKTACAQCHSDVSPSHARPCETIGKPVDCSSCHAEVALQYQGSKHGKLFAANDPNAPTCKECHGGHHILGKRDSTSPIFSINIPKLCSRCHREGEKAAIRYKGNQHDILTHYSESIHGKGLLKSGLTVTATCTGCHTSHNELPASDPNSSVNRSNIAATCAQCHHGIYELFLTSVHSTSKSKSASPLPVCSDCHSAHSIVRTDVENFKLDIMSRCGKCHKEIAKTYFDTYHGKVSQLGYSRTAKCYDCHGAHDILPVSDPASRLSRKNVVQTCQKCHPQASRRFAGYLTHATHHDPKKFPWLFYTFWFMTGLVIVTFTISGIHTLMWLPRALQMRRKRKKETHDPKALQFQRFSTMERVIHILMVISFISLALTGLTLKFSYTRWASIVSHFLGGFKSAGYIHRLAATLMIGIFITHLINMVFVKRKEFGSLRKLIFGPDSLMFNKQDAKDLWHSLKWFIGKGNRPAYRKWTYWEKFDYFAVFWGMGVIGSTGLMLWFPEFFTRVIPGSLINIATIVHSDEALLAAGFIFTVHFFNTHLRPEKFPMDTVIFTGRMPVEELKEDKPAEYDSLIQNGTLEKNLVEPLPEIVVKTYKVFAWSALFIGISIVLWIIYAMIFVYR
jgi:cytochrome b subunit of formate dehydrogenase